MPYYHWKGVGLSGGIKTGYAFACSPLALDLLLFKRDIAILSCVVSSTLFLPSITKETVKNFFERLAVLLRAGVLLPEALAMLRDTMGHVRMQLVLDDIVQQVVVGIPLHKALIMHQAIFDERMVQMVYIGQETGSMPIVVQAMATYLETVLAFRAKIKSAAMAPTISFLFFLAVIAVIIVGIIPTLASVFNSVNQQLPAITGFLLATSNFLRSWFGLFVVVVIAGITFFGIRRLLLSPRFKQLYDGLILKIPFVRDIAYNTQRAWFLDSLALLIGGGMPLVPALSIAERSCVNSKIYEYVSTIGNAVAAGSSLSAALQQCPAELFDPESIAIITVGENVGQLAAVLSQAADISRNRATRSLAIIANVIQPLLFIILGLLITLLILAVYAPIFTLSWVI